MLVDVHKNTTCNFHRYTWIVEVAVLTSRLGESGGRKKRSRVQAQTRDVRRVSAMRPIDPGHNHRLPSQVEIIVSIQLCTATGHRLDAMWKVAMYSTVHNHWHCTYIYQNVKPKPLTGISISRLCELWEPCDNASILRIIYRYISCIMMPYALVRIILQM